MVPFSKSPCIHPLADVQLVLKTQLQVFWESYFPAPPLFSSLPLPENPLFFVVVIVTVISFLADDVDISIQPSVYQTCRLLCL